MGQAAENKKYALPQKEGPRVRGEWPVAKTPLLGGGAVKQGWGRPQVPPPSASAVADGQRAFGPRSELFLGIFTGTRPSLSNFGWLCSEIFQVSPVSFSHKQVLLRVPPSGGSR